MGHLTDAPAIQQGQRCRVASRGSMLIGAYFLLTFMLALVVSQTTRSLSSIRLEERFVDARQLWYLQEAAFDDGIQFLHTIPEYGNTNNASVPDCAASATPWTETAGEVWDCATQLTSQPAVGDILRTTVGTYSVYAKDESPAWRITEYGKVKRKRLRVITTPAEGPPNNAYEMVVETVWNFARNRVYLTGDLDVGNDALLIADIEDYGRDQDNDGVPDGSRQNMIRISPGGVIRGKILVAPPASGAGLVFETATGYDVCCDQHDAIHSLANGSNNQWGGVENPIDLVLLADNRNGNASDTTIDWQVVGHPATPWWMKNEDNTPAPVATFQMGSTPADTCGASHLITEASGDGDIAAGTTRRFCADTEAADVSCDVALGQKKTDPDGVQVVEYCFETLQARANSTVQFQGVEPQDGMPGGRVRVYAIDKINSAAPYAIKLSEGSTSYSFSKGELSPSPSSAKDLILNIPDGNLPCAGGTAPCGVRLMHDARLHGAIYAPKSEVMVGSDSSLLTPSGIAGYIVSENLVLRQGGRIDLTGPSWFSAASQAVREVNVLGWRRCPDLACSQLSQQ